MAKKMKIKLFKTKPQVKDLETLEGESDSKIENQNEIIQSDPIKKNKKKSKLKEQKDTPKLQSVSDHFFTFLIKQELFTLLYTTIIFKWIQSDRILIITDSSQLGYHLELFFKHFHMNSVFLDNEMPVNTNKHYSNCFLKGTINICISSTEYKQNSPQFSIELVDQSPIPCTIIYFDCVSSKLLENHCFNKNTKAIYHFISNENKQKFSLNYETIDESITFSDFTYDKDQVSHLRYRCEGTFHSITKNDIKKAKIKKINQELLHSTSMQDYFKSNPDEKKKIIESIQKNSKRKTNLSASYLPSYLVHEEHHTTANNQTAMAIKKTFKNMSKNATRRKKGKMEQYLEELDKEDGRPDEILNKF